MTISDDARRLLAVYYCSAIWPYYPFTCLPEFAVAWFYLHSWMEYKPGGLMAGYQRNSSSEESLRYLRFWKKKNPLWLWWKPGMNFWFRRMMKQHESTPAICLWALLALSRLLQTISGNTKLSVSIRLAVSSVGDLKGDCVVCFLFISRLTWLSVYLSSGICWTGVLFTCLVNVTFQLR